MGEIERRGKLRRRRRNIKNALLTAIQLAAVVGVAVAAPNLPQALYKTGLLKIRGDGAVISRSRRNLLRRRLLKEEKGFLVLTRAGQRELLRIELGERRLKSFRWDGRWRVLIFDIPEYRKKDREKLRRTLRSVGFEHLQDSVWIYPYDCEDFVALLKADFKIGKDMLYMIVEELEGDSTLRKQFNLRNR
ncbi:MAG: hypothetical protein RLZZ416_454 [Candidatus Parcubacteria bacterium]|jgi:DNA-binding transcriptional regulator PaaX